MQPLVLDLNPPPDVCDVLDRFAEWPHVLLFQSALQNEELGRYSFLSADPRHLLTVSTEATPAEIETAFASLRQKLEELKSLPVPELPPFQGGLAGVVGYEAGRWFERLPATENDAEWPYPAASIGVYDWVIAWDHVSNRAWIIVQPGSHGSAVAAEARLEQIRDRLATSPADDNRKSRPRDETVSTELLKRVPFQAGENNQPGLRSNFDRENYLTAVRRVIRYIRAGDIFQANFSQQLSAPAECAPVDLYRRLARVNPAPFAAYFDAGPFQILSASPERFLRIRGDEVETRPIKGTRARHTLPEADLFTRDELRESDKDQAENVMIVDLLRNDLSRICRPGTIRVPQLCVVETYETVQHLVSVVNGRLEPGRDFFDLLATTFPGGSITGAPKIRAMEIISELERVPRGPYCGTIFYVSVTGDSDSNILIRTFTQADGVLRFPVGGGITAQSNPEAEYEETLHKAAGLLKALNLH
jgi:para-aminobenzoate synthetase component 1